MGVIARILPGRRDLLAPAAAFPQRYPCLLESAARGTAQARWDILFAFPRAALRLDADGVVRDGADRALGTRFLEALDRAWRAEHDRSPRPAEEGDAALPFAGGWVLYLGYELAGEIEPRLRLPAAPEAGVPTALALRCPAAAIVDHARERTVLVAEAGQAALLDALEADLAAAAAHAIPALPAATIEEDAPARFLDGAARIHRYLRAGDTFQVNLSREWRARFAATPAPAALHAALRRANPAPFAGLLQWRDWAVASSSPERLVEVRGDAVQTRPIAGTRPRFAGDDDAARVRELVGHPKERAEHVMLIDLERNDLGRVCVPGSVRVDELMTVESYAHVHHIVSNVRGTLRAGTTPGEVIAATFPGGTITGCPKVRCMEIIAELEGVGRGSYTGALGYLDRRGDLDLNILIRSVLLRGGRARLRAGAGIVADSDAARELEETRHKARGLLRALGAAG
ncbi:anthranilate/para-aminobenzoate synthase component I [Mizugakiibacter sediminis]|uniref:Anthranilate/para-aminobenzoate synthase component I n=1 Tax=Mizugakiibacter sediminis TaxID=1475481 RepID=A0A0K8QJB9_9GAMM|nr:anthranilate/para-aminobenzoate synthase component I [Mizugakiibacter sediminis]